MDKTLGDLADPIERLRGGDRRALAALLDRLRDGLRRMVELRLDPRLRARLDASDVLQEAFLDVAKDLDACLASPDLPPLLWLRPHVGRRLTTLHRQHLGLRMCDAGLEISLYQGAMPEASSVELASMLLGRHIVGRDVCERIGRWMGIGVPLSNSRRSMISSTRVRHGRRLLPERLREERNRLRSMRCSLGEPSARVARLWWNQGSLPTGVPSLARESRDSARAGRELPRSPRTCRCFDRRSDASPSRTRGPTVARRIHAARGESTGRG